MRLLLDTCTFLWIATDAKELSSRVRSLFEDPDNEVHLSAVSAWEIGLKHGLGRLHLPEAPDSFVPRYREAHGISPLPLGEGEALQVGKLPPHHSDPFDRMLVCQAIVGCLTILTPDPEIARYPVQVAW